MVTIVTTSLATSWACAVAAAVDNRTAAAGRFRSRMRRPWAVGVLGALVPGLGLLIAGYPKRAALTLGIVGPMAAAAVILLNWRWLWERNQFAASSGISGTALEITFLAAAGIVVVMLLIWIVQFLDGVRRVSTSRSRGFADAIGFALLVSIILFLTTFQPTPLAQNLYAAAASFQDDGFLVIPLALCETATRLDPASPAYLARAAELNEALGMKIQASAKREIIDRRAREYLEVADVDVNGEVGSGTMNASHINGYLFPEDYVTSNDLHSWSRLRFQPR
jgi:hypothetical protein